jgi:urease beta subunit
MRRSTPALMLALLLPLTACGDGPSEPAAQVSGSYHLQTINGQPLPFILEQAGANRLEMVSSTITFEADGRFTDVALLRLTQAGEVQEVADTLAGTYAQSGHTVTLSPDDGGSLPLFVSGTTLTQTINIYTLVYTK